MNVPVVDFSACSLTEADVGGEHVHNLSGQLHAAFTEVGLVFLQNTGISQEEVRPAGWAGAVQCWDRTSVCVCVCMCARAQVSRVLDAAKRFFLLPDDEKRSFSRKNFASSPNHGWVPLETERWAS